MTTVTGTATQRYEIPGPSFTFTITNSLIGCTALIGVWWCNNQDGHLMIALTSAVVVFLISCIKGGDPSIVDRLWSVEPPLYCWYTYWKTEENASSRVLFMSILVTLWGFRLTWNFWIKGGYVSGSEDYRWVQVRKWFSGWKFRVFDFIFICLFQQLLLLSITSSIAHQKNNNKPFPTMSDGIAAALFLLFFLGETISDWQMYKFQTKKWNQIKQNKELTKEYKQGFISSGFWAYSRHPNYMCEILLWWSFFLFAYLNSCAQQEDHYSVWWTALGPCILTSLFVAPGASADLTEVSASKYPEYSQYQQRVPKFCPSFFNIQTDNNSDYIQPYLSSVSRWIYLGFFTSHIPITVLLDIQAILPRNYFPTFALELLNKHKSINHDDLMAQPPLWLQSLIWCELLFQLPFFFVAIKVLLLKREIAFASFFRVYAAHVSTTLVPILAHFACAPNFPSNKIRCILFLIYAPCPSYLYRCFLPFLLLSVILLFPLPPRRKSSNKKQRELLRTAVS